MVRLPSPLGVPAILPADGDTGADRVVLLDILRGFALLGILIVHYWGQTGVVWPAADRVAGRLIELLAEESFYPIFAFLFGIGFAIQLTRPASSRRSQVAYFIRRLGILLAIGALHLVFLYDGDVLVQYALLGMVLVPLRNLSHRTLPVVVCTLFLLQVGAGPVESAIARARDPSVVNVAPGGVAQSDPQPWFERGTVRSAAPSYGEDVRRRAGILADTVLEIVTLRSLPFNDVLLLFLFGMLVGRTRWMHDARDYRGRFAVVAVCGFLAAVAGHAYLATGGGRELAFHELAFRAANTGLSVVYVCLIAIAVGTGRRAARLLRGFGPVGNMALSNYVLQSLCLLLFVPYGLSLPFPGAAAALAMSCGFFVVQCLLSRWWLDRFRYGPLEWVWRSLTYGSAQRMRRIAGAPR